MLSVAVIGVADERWGEVGCAYVIALPGHTLTAELIDAHCGPSLARYKIPKKYVFVDELPRTASGKVMKPAKLANGTELQVADFIEIDDLIEIDTREGGSYKGRAKK